jgi:hypothetical protein
VLLWGGVLGVLLHLGVFNIENAPRCILVPPYIYIYIYIYIVYLLRDKSPGLYITVESPSPRPITFYASELI